MENLDSDMGREGSLFGRREISVYLYETAKWGSFLAIVGYVLIGLMVIGCVVVMAAGSSDMFPGVPVPVGVLGLVYLLIALLYYFPVTYLYKFSSKIKEGIRSQSLDIATEAFSNLKSLYKFMGICMIIVLSLYALIFVGALATAALM